MKRIFLFVLLFSLTSVFGQQYAAMFGAAVKNKEVVVLTAKDELTQKATLFLSDAKRIYSYRLNERLGLRDSLSSKRPHSIFSKIVGYANFETKSVIYWSNDSYSSFLIQSFDYQQRTVAVKQFNLNTAETIPVQFISGIGEFTMLVQDNATKQFRLERFDETDTQLSLPLNTEKLNSYYLSILTATRVDSEEDSGSRVERADSAIGLFFAESGKRNKLYTFGRQAIFTFDSDPEKTVVLVLDLEKNEFTEHVLEKPQLSNGAVALFSNSYIVEDNVFQLTGSASEMMLTVKRLDNTLLASYSTASHPDVFDSFRYFKESYIGIPNALASREDFMKRLDRTVSLSVHRVDSTYVVSIGKTIPREKINDQNSVNFMMFYPVGSALEGALIGAFSGLANAIFFSSYNGSAGRTLSSSMNNGRLYTNFCMDTAFQPTTPFNRDLAFDKLRKTIKDRPSESGQTLFSLNGIVYFGFFNFAEKRYFIQKFTN